MKTFATQSKLPVFAARFRELRGGKTQGEFADFLGISRPTVGFYENGDRIPDAFVLKQIAVKCEVTTDWLVGISNVKTLDTDLESVCKYTGLTDKAINSIKNINCVLSYDFLTGEQYFIKNTSNYNCLSNVLSNILSSREIEIFKTAIYKALLYYSKQFRRPVENDVFYVRSNMLKNLQEDTDLSELLENEGLTVIDTLDAIDFEIKHASDVFWRLLNDAVETEGTRTHNLKLQEGASNGEHPKD
ncbi:helix-turn-helix domain-containing protein [Anaerotruncus rubiinfantis]|uniref:helix-turn-helix domain-containing protein n=1 Tax=Anaerotruncus rubiinfantis TaxID=1720200 RepID=UPI003D78E650